MNQHLIENRQIRIFISSTFQDMQEERDYLMNKTFPLLRKKAAERDVTLVELDLRWGITEAEAQNGKVIEVCLNEIENSHPFFIGLLGERYGWSPSVEELMKNENLKDRYGWIEKDLKAGLSITEIEMQYGVLRSKDPVYAYFYIKQEVSLSEKASSPKPFWKQLFGVSDIEQQTDTYKLKRLKAAVRNNKRYPVASYSDVENLGNQIEIAFIELLDKLFPRIEITQLEKERIAQKAFLNSRYDIYIPDEKNFLTLDEFLENKEQQHYVVTGASGMGKSALIANWLKRHEDDVNWNIIYHFVGNSGSEVDYRHILKRLIDEVRDMYKLLKKEDWQQLGQKEELKDELQDLLIQLSATTPLLIVLDGINQLEEKEYVKRLNWLPILPKHVKMLFSTLEQDLTMNTFRELQYPLLILQPLNSSKQRTFIVDYLHKYGKKLAETQLIRIIENKLTKNTLVLRTLLDELIRFGVHEKLNECIDYYLKAKDISDFFQRVLYRCEQDYGKDMIRRTLSYIAVSRNGLREDELLILTNLFPLYWSQFYCAFASHFTIKNGLITFSHQYIREAVENAYLMEKETVNDFRKAIVRHFRQEYYYRAYDELPYQYDLLDDDSGLYYFLLDFKAFGYIFNKNIYELGVYWRKLLKSKKNIYSLKEYLHLSIEGIEKDDLNAFYNYIGYFVGQIIADHSLSLEFYKKSLCVCEKVFSEEHLSIASSYNNIGSAYSNLSDYTHALEYYQKALRLRQKTFGEKHPDIAQSYNNVGKIYDSLGDYSHALEYYQKALFLWEETLGKRHSNIAISCNNIAGIYDTLGEYSKALLFYKKALDILEQTLGQDHPNTAFGYNNIGNLYCNLSDNANALKYYQKALSIWEKTLGEEHPNIALGYNNIGTIFSDQGNYSSALDFYQKALRIYLKVLGEEHPDTASSYNNIGSIYSNKGDYSTALDFYRKALSIYQKTLGEEHPNTATSYTNIGTLFVHLNDNSNALCFYQKALNIWEKTLGKEHLSTVASYDNIAKTYFCLQQYQNALPYFIKEIEWSIRNKIEFNESILDCYSYAGMCYYTLSDYKNAIYYLSKVYNHNQINENEIYSLACSLYQRLLDMKNEYSKGLT